MEEKHFGWSSSNFDTAMDFAWFLEASEAGEWLIFMNDKNLSTGFLELWENLFVR